MNKTELLKAIADGAGITKAQAGLALGVLVDSAEKELKAGTDFLVPGLVRLKVRIKPAAPARQGIHPFTKEPVTLAARPESRAVKAAAVTSLKKSVA